MKFVEVYEVYDRYAFIRNDVLIWTKSLYNFRFANKNADANDRTSPRRISF